MVKTYEGGKPLCHTRSTKLSAIDTPLPGPGSQQIAGVFGGLEAGDKVGGQRCRFC
jgi:hypothetical protein